MSSVLSGVLAGLAVAVALRRRSRAHVLVAVAGARAGARATRAGAGAGTGAQAGAGAGARAGASAAATGRRVSPALACGLAAVAVLLVLPWPTSAVVALVVAGAGPRVLGRLEPGAVRRERERLTADLPLVLDLLGACLAGGASPPAAAAAVARAVGGPAGDRLHRVATALSVGTPGAAAWSSLDSSGRPDEPLDARRASEHVPDTAPRTSDPMGPAARALSRSADGGARVVDVLARLAEEERRRERARGAEAARRAGVLAVAPLGLCHLPSFVLLGVVPVVAGLAAPVLSAR